MTTYELVTLVLVALTGHNPFDIRYIVERDEVKWKKEKRERKEKKGADRFEKLEEGAQRLRTNTSIFSKSHFLL